MAKNRITRTGAIRTVVKPRSNKKGAEEKLRTFRFAFEPEADTDSVIAYRTFTVGPDKKGNMTLYAEKEGAEPVPLVPSWVGSSAAKMTSSGLTYKMLSSESREPPRGDVRERAMSLGGAPGVRLSKTAAKAVLARVSRESLDLFDSEDRAKEFLERPGPGDSASPLDMIEKGQTASVLVKLDQLRYGPQG